MLAVDPGQCPVQDGRAGRRGVPRHAGELVAARDREPAAQVLVARVQHVDAEAARRGDLRPAGGRLGGPDGDKLGVERDWEERADGQPRWRATGHRGDYDHAGREVPEHLTEPCLIDLYAGLHLGKPPPRVVILTVGQTSNRTDL